MNLKNKDFLSSSDLTAGEMKDIFQLAKDMKSDRKKYIHSREGHTLAMIFEKPSLRTRVTFDVGIRQLGGNGIFLGPSDISLGKRESVHDVAKNLERIVDVIMIRTFAHKICTDLADHAEVPVINGLTDLEHPCQALADYFTAWEIFGDLEGKKLAFLGDGNNVANSLLLAGARLGVNVTVATPRGYEPKEETKEKAMKDSSETGTKITITNDPNEAADGADIVYTDVWASMGQESEAEARKEIFRPYQVNGEIMSKAKPGAVFMHCLPAHRGEEVTSEVIDSDRSVVFKEAENRLHIQKALMYEILRD